MQGDMNAKVTPSSLSSSLSLTSRQIQRLAEMGFDRNAVINSLNANNGDEEAALNGLLSGTPPAPLPAQPAAPSQPQPVPQQPPQQQSGFFGKIWGK
jgi:hypothetical protein